MERMVKIMTLMGMLMFVTQTKGQGTLLNEDASDVSQYDKIVISNVRIEGVGVEGYTERMYFTATNTGDEEFDGTIGSGDRFETHDGKYSKRLFEEMKVTIGPGEAKDLEMYFHPFVCDREEHDELMIYLNGQINDPIYTQVVDVENNRKLKSEIKLNIAGEDIDMSGSPAAKRNIVSISTCNPVFTWEYKNMENAQIYDELRIFVEKASYTLTGWAPIKLIQSNCLWTGLPSRKGLYPGETVSGQFTIEEPLENGECYVVETEFGYKYFEGYWFYIGDAASPMIIKYEEPTGINEVDAEKKSLPVYTLGGVRVTDTENLPKGIYIRGGKKFVVK